MRSTMLPRLPRALVLGAAAALAPATVALAAQQHPPKPTVRLDPACYQSGQEGQLSGRGFDANATWKATLSGTRKHQLGSGRTDARGRIDARFSAPAYHGTTGTRALTLSVGDGRHTARTTLRMTPLAASFTPRTGDPATLRVRWRVLGLTPRHGVYVHYIRPSGTLRRTLRIGTTHGPCGTLKTGPIALFPFRAGYGRWTFQIDASRHWSRATLPRLLIRFDIKRPPKREQEQSAPPS